MASPYDRVFGEIDAQRSALGLNYWIAQSLLHRIMTIMFKNTKFGLLGELGKKLSPAQRTEVHKQMYGFLKGSRCIRLSVLLGDEDPAGKDENEFLAALFFDDTEVAARAARFWTIKYYDKIHAAAPSLFVCTGPIRFAEGAIGGGLFLRNKKDDKTDRIQYHITMPEDTKDYHMTNRFFSRRRNDQVKHSYYYNSGRYREATRRNNNSGYDEIVGVSASGLTFYEPGTPPEVAARRAGASPSPAALAAGSGGAAAPGGGKSIYNDLTPAEALALARLRESSASPAGGSSGLTSKQRKQLKFSEKKAAEAAEAAEEAVGRAGGDEGENNDEAAAAAPAPAALPGGEEAAPAAAGGEGEENEEEENEGAAPAAAGGEGKAAAAALPPNRPPVRHIADINLSKAQNFVPAWLRAAGLGGVAAAPAAAPPPPPPMLYDSFQVTPIRYPDGYYYWVFGDGRIFEPLSQQERLDVEASRLFYKFILYDRLTTLYVGFSYLQGGQIFRGGKRKTRSARRHKQKTRRSKQRG